MPESLKRTVTPRRSNKGRRGGRRGRGGDGGALSTIFDIIFAKAKEGKGKNRPYRYTGDKEGVDEVANALGEIAANPLLYAGDAALAPVNEMLNAVNFVEYRLDQRDTRKYKYYDSSASRVRIRAGDLGKAFSNPNKFIDGVLAGTREENKWMKVAALGAGLDAAVAWYGAKKNGMTSEEAMEFGKAALASYSDGMEKTHKKLLAGNAAMEAELKKTMDQFRRDPAWKGKEKTREFGVAVQKELEKRANVVLERESLLVEAINQSTNTAGAQYGVKWSAPKYLDENVKTATKSLKQAEQNLEEANKSGSAYKIRNAENAKVRAEKDLAYAEKVKTETYDGHKERMESRYAEMESYLSTKISDPEEVKRLMTEFKNEVKNRKGEDITAYRMDMHEYYKKKILFTADEAEQRRLSGAANTVLVWERLKGNQETTGAGIGQSVKDAEGIISSLKAAGPLTAEQSEYVKKLEAHIAKLDSIESRLGSNRHKVDSWIEPNLGFEDRPADNKVALKGLQEQLELDRTNLSFMAKQAEIRGDFVEVRRLMLASDSLAETINGLNSTRFTNFRHKAAAMAYQYRAVGGLSGIGSGLITGTAYFTAGAGLIAPGEFQNAGTSVLVKNEKGEFVQQGRYEKGPLLVMGRTDINSHLADISKLYYLTPGSLAKTLLFNGEGFHFLAKMNERKIQDMFGRDKGGLIKSYLESKAADPDFYAKFKKFYTVNDSGLTTSNPKEIATNYLEFMALLEERGDTLPPELRAIVAKMKARYDRRVQSWAKVGDFYMRVGLQKKMIGYTTRLKGYRDRVLESLGLKDWRKRLLLKFSKNEVWKSAVGKFFDGAIGVRQLVSSGLKVAITSFVAALGFATTGGMANVIAALVWVGTEVAFKLVKPILGVVFLTIFAACGVLGFTYFTVGDLLAPHSVAHNAIVPGTVVQGGSTFTPGGGNTGGAPIPGNPSVDSICPINPGAQCMQGPFGAFSHARMQTYAIDVGTNAGIWKAPNDGSVTAVFTGTCNVGADNGKAIGTTVIFQDSAGTIYRMLHADALVSQGAKVSKGQAVASISYSVTPSACWTGPHFHLDTKSGGGWVNSREWYNKLQCNISPC